MKLKRISLELVLPFITAWFLMTVLVDIVTIPTVFRNSTSIVDAGKIGMTVFGRFNAFEIVFAVIILIGSIVNLKVHNNKKWIFFAAPLLMLSLVYKFYMTPMITNTTYEIHKTAVTDPAYVELQSKHAQYHNTYRYFDTTKLIVLLVFAGIVLSDRVKSKENV
jgi:hypothetical protein